MEFTRRRLMSTLSAAGLLAVLPLRTAAASARPRAADAALLLAHTRAVFAGTPATNARPEAAAKIAAIHDTARANLAAMADTGSATGELFAGVPLGTSDVNLATSYRMLYEIALATRTPGGDLHGDSAAQRRVVDGLVWLHERYYGDQSQGYYGNWHNWEIAISTHVGKTFALLADVPDTVPAGLLTTYVAAMDAYLRNGKDGDVDLDSRFHTGANLADITTNRIIQGALLAAAQETGGEARIAKALEDQLTVFATIDPYDISHGNTDGYYADGSFIQHHSVAYTGSYGKALLTRVVQTLKILDGTGFANTDALVPVVQRWVRDGFAPLIFEGWMMEIVKGRAVSRTTSGYTDVAVVVEAVVDLADYATGADAAALKSYVKHIRATSRAALDPTGFVSPVSVVRYADIVGDDAVPPADLNAAARSVAFNAMDRHVHRRPGFAFALARSSDRISKYEYMSGENLMPWFQGDGAYYLYLSGQDQTRAYGVDYYTVVSPYGLAGATAPVERRGTVPELYDGRLWYENPGHPLNFTSSSESQNTYVYFPRGTNRHSGGAVLDAYGTAAMVQSDDVAYAERDLLPDDFVVYRNATAVKSWFMLDDEIVVLAAGVGDRAGRAVTTTVDARTADPSAAVTVTGARRDGRAWEGPGTAELRWLRYADAAEGTAVGYVFLDDAPPVRVGLEDVTRSRRVVRTGNPDTAVTRTVFSATVDHEPGRRRARLAYALVPHASAGRLDTYRSRGPVNVIANSTRMQAVHHSALRLTAANTFTPGRHDTAGLSIDGPASVLVRTGDDGRMGVAVADPTMDRDTVTVVLRGLRLRKAAGDDGVRVSRVPGGTKLVVDTHHAYGRSLTASLER